MPLFIFCDFHDVTDIDAQCTANSYKHIEPYILIFCELCNCCRTEVCSLLQVFFLHAPIDKQLKYFLVRNAYLTVLAFCTYYFKIIISAILLNNKIILKFVKKTFMFRRVYSSTERSSAWHNQSCSWCHWADR